jgi:hypothetical protein
MPNDPPLPMYVSPLHVAWTVLLIGCQVAVNQFKIVLGRRILVLSRPDVLL